MIYRERHWMTDTPQDREVALTWDGVRYGVDQWDPKWGWCRLPFRPPVTHWRPLPPSPGGVDVSAWCAVEGP